RVCRRGGQGPAPLAPFQNRSEPRATTPGREPAVGGEVFTPVDRGRQFGDRVLPGADVGSRRGSQDPLLQRSSAGGGRGGPQPLHERGAAEEIEVLRVGVVLDIRRGI